MVNCKFCNNYIDFEKETIDIRKSKNWKVYDYLHFCNKYCLIKFIENNKKW